MTDDPERRLRRLMEATGENTKAGAIDVGMKHYLAGLKAKQSAVERLDSDVVELLSTPHLPMERTVETAVGRDSV